MLSGEEGGCDCGKVRYRLEAEPIVTKCCHCHACQRQTGSAFALNLVIETVHITLLGEAPEAVEMPTQSGHGQANFRCPHCRISLWSTFHQAGDKARFVRAGTLDNTHAVVPDLHIFTKAKQDWVVIPEGAEAFEAFYRGKDVPRVFGETNAARWKAVLER
ncbi:GFA family protein [Novosphingobium decolorationis]|uniref:GFA family protein n=1 Tax=Novosphingobium decolorationis TaxID=2698673 RepID=A0ABX8E1Y5_9SPHN|nr:GFA family protein [Novosphingobium decolorationis]QVM82900.1 GFA family protein [Novosphingobium decolorationis]